jgi:hypothetical protein
MTAVYYTDYSVEAKFDGTNWTRINSDIVSTIALEYGIQGANSLVRVADPGKLEFELNNTETNSAGLVGYYSPGHVNCRSGFGPGLTVRICFELDYKIQKFTGEIPVDGISVQSGVYGSRRVKVRVMDWMHQASTHQIQAIAYANNKTIMEGVALVLANMPKQPPGTTRYYTGESTFVSLFDIAGGATTALSEFGKFAASEMSYIYLTRHGLTVEGRLTRNIEKMYPSEFPVPRDELVLLINEDPVYIINEDSDRILISDSDVAVFTNAQYDADISYGTNYYNQVKFTAYPRRIDAAATTELFTLQKSMEILAGETLVVEGKYTDPSGVSNKVAGIDMVTPTAGNHWAAYENDDGTGTDLTSSISVTAAWGIDKFQYTITNSGADAWITMLKAVGKGVYTDETVAYYTEDATGVAAYGGHMLSHDMKYQDDASVARRWARIQRYQYSSLQSYINSISFHANRKSEFLYAMLYLEPGDRISISESVTGVDEDYFIQGVRIAVGLGGKVDFTWSLKAARLDTFYITEWDDDGSWDDAIYGWDF